MFQVYKKTLIIIIVCINIFLKDFLIFGFL